MSSGFRRAFCAVGAAFVVVGLGVSLSGCPVAAELEDPGRFPALAGASGSGSVDCNQPIPDLAQVLNCDYAGALKAHCGKGGCHNNPAPPGKPAAELDLTLDTFLIARILEVPSKHIITCSGMGQCNHDMPQCDGCGMCPSDDMLLTKTDVTESWILRKMAAFDFSTPTIPTKMGCGTAMPIAPGNTGFTEERRTCLTNFFTWVAENGRPCDITAGGSGGGGAGGAGGAGSGGTGGT